MTTSAEIVRRCDAGEYPDTIAAALGVTVGRVYAVLQEHRPDRPRKPRGRTSDVPRKVLGLHSRGIKPARIAFLLNIKRQYVYRILAEQSE